MKKIGSAVAMVVLLSFGWFALADAKVPEWIGEYGMNHDGWKGTLVISDTKADCAGSPWCAMAIRYTDSKGKRIRGTIDKIDEKFQHMVFHLEFPDNRQKFDAYLFSWDKSSMAGTTYWHGRTFGFYAIKK